VRGLLARKLTTNGLAERNEPMSDRARVRKMDDRTLMRAHNRVGESLAWRRREKRPIEEPLAQYWEAICDECVRRFGY
jgi:hypothetical protein